MLLDIFIQILFILHGFPSPVSAQHQRYKCVPLKQRLNVKLPPKCFSLCLKVWYNTWKYESENPDDAPYASQHRDRLQARHQVHVCRDLICISLTKEHSHHGIASQNLLQHMAVLLESRTGDTLGPTGDLVSILGPTGDWSRRPAAARPYIGGATPNLHLPKLKSPLTNILNLTIQILHRHHMNQ